MHGLIATTPVRPSLAGRMLPLLASLSLLQPARGKLSVVVRLCSTPWHRIPVPSEKASTANLIKLSGNFLIMSIIDSLGETFAPRGNRVSTHGNVVFHPNRQDIWRLYRRRTSLAGELQDEPGAEGHPPCSCGSRLAARPDAVCEPNSHRMLTVAELGEGITDWSVLARLSVRNAGLHS